jgi:hypothetical protein
MPINIAPSNLPNFHSFYSDSAPQPQNGKHTTHPSHKIIGVYDLLKK